MMTPDHQLDGKIKTVFRTVKAFRESRVQREKRCIQSSSLSKTRWSVGDEQLSLQQENDRTGTK
jgi:hypothetical protein